MMENRSLLSIVRQPSTITLPFRILAKLTVLIIPITQIVMGFVHLRDCPVQPYIPIYLVVGGFCAVILTVLSSLPCIQEDEHGQHCILNAIFTFWNSVISLFLFCWFIAGNVWIYSVYQPDYDIHQPLYCEKSLYLFAFWTTTLYYILLFLMLVLGLCVLCCMFMFSEGPVVNTEDV